MCGISGILSKNTNEVHPDRLKKMTDAMAHRGPDGEGQWIHAGGEVGLAHRRLSIIDLSHEADQPMHYMDRYSIVFNGEIYNYIELRENLLQEGYTFRTASDTEVLMALYDRHGETCLRFLDGMFAFVLFDHKENSAFCARDRFGEKPFFYSYQPGHSFYFGSEMKCLWAAGIPKEINHRMLFNYLSYGFLENPDDLSETFYQHCTRLPHAHCISIQLNTMELRIKRYYDIDWTKIKVPASREEAEARFRELFFTSIQRRLRSDVSVGSSLSGGLDSSAVVCVIDQLKKGGGQVQKTFSAVFPGFKKDERKYMDLVIAKTQVEPHFVTPSDDGLLQELDKLAFHQEEPFGSASIYVQYKVMELARKNKVTVLLDGQGADEVLAGYHPYYTQYFTELRRRNPALYKSELAAYYQMHAGSEINIDVVGGWKNKIRTLVPGYVAFLRKKQEWYKHITNPVLSKDYFHSYYQSSFQNLYQFKSLNHQLYSSTMQKGLQELLRYADRNSMAHSREVRLPFLSHELVEFIFSLPPEYKIHEGWTKWILRSSMQELLPADIAWRKDKIGYEPPQKSWMDNSFIKDRIMDCRSTMITDGILSSSLNKQAYKSEDALHGDNRNWKILMAHNLFQKS